MLKRPARLRSGKGMDKQRVGQVSAEIRAFRPPEPYKGKGFDTPMNEAQRSEEEVAKQEKQDMKKKDCSFA